MKDNLNTENFFEENDLLDAETMYVDQEIYNSDTQEEWNAEALFKFDQKSLLKLIDKPIERYTLEYYLDVLSDSDINYWNKVLKKIIKTYCLSYLESILFSIDKTSEYKSDVIDLVRDIKTTLAELVRIGTITMNTKLSEMQKIVDEKVTSRLLKESIKYMSQKSYEKFLRVLIQLSI